MKTEGSSGSSKEKTPAKLDEKVTQIIRVIKERFDKQQIILTFGEYLSLLAANPERHLRCASQYNLDMMDSFGKRQTETGAVHFNLFDLPIDGIAPKVVGHDRVQTEIYNTLRGFVQQGMINRLILLHGPNGSAKTTIVQGLMAGLERYSQTDDGAIYTFNWVFPIERYTKKGMGFQTDQDKGSDLESFAKLPDEELAARIPSELRDHPLLLIPVNMREMLLIEIFGSKKGSEFYANLPTYLAKGDLGPRSKQMFEALLNANDGDFRKVLKHVQVERFFFSRRYRKGLATIEPQLHVDAQYSQLSYNKSLSSLPASLQSLNFFELTGDLVEGNRGMIEYSDLLKRPIDSFKYLLIACEKGAVNVGHAIAHLNSVLIGSSNELQLDAFKEFPDFSSFMARMQLIRVPYLLSARKEEELYSLVIKAAAGSKHVAPHVSWTLALWAVLTRLKKPNSINYPPNLSSIISSLTPLQKARIYDNGELPHGLTAEDRKLLKAHLQKIADEYSNIPYYEGRMGASVREIKTVLFQALQNPEFRCLSPLPIFLEMHEFVKKISEYEFLKQDVKDGYHDAQGFIQNVRDEYLNIIDKEVRDSIGLYDSDQWSNFMKRYILHLSHLIRKERVANPVTGKLEEPDQSLIGEFESIVEAPKDKNDREGFRKNIISQVGAWSLDHPNQAVDYAKVFPDFWARLEKHYFLGQKGLLLKMNNSLLVLGTEAYDPYSEGSRLAKQTIDNMKNKLGYCEQCARDVVMFFMKARYGGHSSPHSFGPSSGPTSGPMGPAPQSPLAPE